MSAANILLGANQPQGMSTGMAANASAMLGLGAPGANLQDQLQDQIAARRKAIGVGSGGFGANMALFGTTK